MHFTAWTGRRLRRLRVASPLARLGSKRGTEALWSTKLTFEILVISATRPGEVRLASGEEIDLEEAVWTIPGEWMKANREQRAPLSGRAMEVLREAVYARSDLFDRGRTLMEAWAQYIAG